MAEIPSNQGWSKHCYSWDNLILSTGAGFVGNHPQTYSLMVQKSGHYLHGIQT